jgi:hypothetical protein
LVAVAVIPDGTVYAVDSQASRLFKLRPGSQSMEFVMRVDARDPTALAAADERTLYLADAGGVIRVDLSARAAVRVKTAEDLSGFESLAWRAGTLLGIERVAGSYLVVRLKLDPSGTHAQPRQILAASPASAVGTLAGDSFYYLSSEQTIRRIPLR